MTHATFKLAHAGPFLSLQDRGRFGYMRYGVTPSGPMDRASHAIAHTAAQAEGAILEVSLGGLTLVCTSGETTAAVAGGAFNITLDGAAQSAWSSFTLREGSKLTIRPGPWGSWCYLAFAGRIKAPTWLGSQSTHLDTGLCGLPLSQDHVLHVENARVLPDRNGPIIDPDPLRPDKTTRLVLGPQDRFFTAPSLAKLTQQPFTLTPDYNRMGVRLSGPKLEINAELTMPSEPIARGSLQVPGHGDPICLMADHQTTGGYPKIATVISADMDAFTQRRVGDTFRFKAVSPQEANKAARDRAGLLMRLNTQIQEQRISLEQRLWTENLISGVIGPDV
ncbi:MAG: biotin-dependent carboxyltransferase family protein [Litoreibacter sp.]